MKNYHCKDCQYFFGQDMYDCRYCKNSQLRTKRWSTI